MSDKRTTRTTRTGGDIVGQGGRALAEQIGDAHQRITDQAELDTLLDALSNDEIHDERALAERMRARLRGHRERKMDAELDAAEQIQAAELRRAEILRQAEADELDADIRDLRLARKALARHRRAVSPQARVADLYRHRQWSARGIVFVVMVAMGWSAFNVQHNIAGGLGPTDGLWWFSYGLEALISVLLLILMSGAPKLAEWGVKLDPSTILAGEGSLLSLTIGLNVFPFVKAGDWYNVGVHAVAPVMIGVAMLINQRVVAQGYGQAMANAAELVPPDPERMQLPTHRTSVRADAPAGAIDGAPAALPGADSAPESAPAPAPADESAPAVRTPGAESAQSAPADPAADADPAHPAPAHVRADRTPHPFTAPVSAPAAVTAHPAPVVSAPTADQSAPAAESAPASAPTADADRIENGFEHTTSNPLANADGSSALQGAVVFEPVTEVLPIVGADFGDFVGNSAPVGADTAHPADSGAESAPESAGSAPVGPSVPAAGPHPAPESAPTGTEGPHPDADPAESAYADVRTDRTTGADLGADSALEGAESATDATESAPSAPEGAHPAAPRWLVDEILRRNPRMQTKADKVAEVLVTAATVTTAVTSIAKLTKVHRDTVRMIRGTAAQIHAENEADGATVVNLHRR